MLSVCYAKIQTNHPALGLAGFRGPLLCIVPLSEASDKVTKSLSHTP